MMYEYLSVYLVRERLAELEAAAQRQAVLNAVRPPRRPMLRLLGVSLIRLGRWILRHVPKWVGDGPRVHSLPRAPRSW
ncbi:MAG: hypothetical protein ACRELA_04035 [Candidatus Rokuibacteriota bacterium]